MDATTSSALQILVSPFLGAISDNLSNFIQKEIGLALGANKELEKLSSTLSTIRDVLEDAENKQITNKPIRSWLRKLKELMNDIEDILDECAIEALIPESEINRKKISCSPEVISGSLSSCFNFKWFMFRYTIGKKIKKIREKLDGIAEDRSKFHLNNNLLSQNVESRGQQHRETSSTTAEAHIYGRDEEKEHLVQLLLDNTSEGVDHQGDLPVCCIVGMGGLGKTTLAQMVYNDERVVNSFNVKLWVSVSEKFETKDILKAILESLDKNSPDIKKLDPLQRHLEEILSGKTFLLVLDDVWNVDQREWDILRSSLRSGGKGSSIVITTRLDTVALMTGTRPMCRPKVLSDEECWSLFKHCAFDVKNEERHQNLESIGKEIVKKCGGVPLAAKALGGLLRFKRGENEWLFVKDSEIWDLPQDKRDAILPALRLSYNHLPSHLKQCFAYCSIFPKGYVINKEELILLWLANDFIQARGRSMELEDIGNEYFNELLWRSFFQDVTKDDYGNITWCTMHGLLHDLACSISSNECLVREIGKQEIFPRNIRHLSLVFGVSTSTSSVLDSSMTKLPTLLRTFIQLQSPHQQPKKIPQFSCSNWKYLRVLDLSWSEITALPESIGELKHLRYVNLSHTAIISLPNELICTLRNLQTMLLNECDKLKMLPRDIRKMNSLRHLSIKGCNMLTEMPAGMGQLAHLQTLSIYIVGLNSMGGGIRELEGLDHLRGELEIKRMERVKSSIDARSANLMKKHNLLSLRLCWSHDSWKQENKIDDEEEDVVVAEGLQPHPNLKRLHIEYFQGEFPSWMGSFLCLPNMVEISLENCRCKYLPSFGQIPLLKYLHIRKTSYVKCIGNEFYGENREGFHFFSSLEKLTISDMTNLEEWSSPSELAFPRLRTLKFFNCPKLMTCPSLPLSLQHLQLWECNEVLLRRTLERLPYLPCLSKLSMKGFNELVNFPDGGMVLQNLVSLRSLKIDSFPKLKTMPTGLIKNLMALTHLTIRGCDELNQLPKEMQHLTSLQSLYICSCHDLSSLPQLGSCGTFKELRIQCCTRLTSLSRVLQDLETLETLQITDCPQLELLEDDFRPLIALQDLELGNLPMITSLPVVGLEHLPTTLKRVDIYGCTSLLSLPAWVSNLISL